MKKIIIAYIYLFVLINLSFSQDTRWIIARQVHSSNDPLSGLIDMKFEADTLSFIHLYANSYPNNIMMNACNTSISDTLGNLLFYTNGLTIFHAQHDTMQNAKGFNEGPVVYEGSNFRSMPTPQTVLILPNPTQPNIYDLFHNTPTNNWGSWAADGLQHSRIDMAQDSGRGALVEKNTFILHQPIATGFITACKHANGKDWWILTNKQGQGWSAYYRILYTGDSIYPAVKQTIGPYIGTEQTGFALFTPDGTKYVSYLWEDTLVRVFDFDRCTGLLSNYRSMKMDFLTIQDRIYSLSISPNSRFLYVNSYITLKQYDLWASDISASEKHIANYDGYICSFPNDTINGGSYAAFFAAQLAPNNKIYMSSTGFTNVYHVIYYPDSEGIACHFEQHAVQFPMYTEESIPYFPYYRLGASDTPCYGVDKEEGIANKEISVYPNPATQHIYIETASLQGRGEVLIYNPLGQEVYRETAVFSEREKEVYIGNLPNGAYYVRIFTEKEVLQAKFFKE